MHANGHASSPHPLPIPQHGKPDASPSRPLCVPMDRGRVPSRVLPSPRRAARAKPQPARDETTGPSENWRQMFDWPPKMAKPVHSNSQSRLRDGIANPCVGPTPATCSGIRDCRPSAMVLGTITCPSTVPVATRWDEFRLAATCRLCSASWQRATREEYGCRPSPTPAEHRIPDECEDFPCPEWYPSSASGREHIGVRRDIGALR